MSERLDDGFATLVEFANIPSPLHWEKTVTPPGVDGGGPNDTSTMRNTRWRTMAPRKLKSLTAMTLVAAYDPAIYDDVDAQLQVNQLVTITFSDGSTLAFWGWIERFEPGEISEGGQPTITMTIQPSNQDDNGDEIAPVYTAAA